MRLSRTPYFAFRLELLRRRALRHGLLGNSPWWRALSFVFLGWRVLRFLLARHPEVVTTERLRPGQGIALRAIPYVSRRARRRAAAGR